VRNHKRRLERLERPEGGQETGVVIVWIEPGETEEEALKEYYANYPENQRAHLLLIFETSDQAPPSAPAPPRPQPQESAKAPGPAPMMITK
jgi:hypothetical protein